MGSTQERVEPIAFWWLVIGMASPFDGLYIDRKYLSSLGLIPPSDYAFVEDGDLALIIRAHQDVVDSMLLKRYQVPYTDYVPPAIKIHLAAMVFDHIRGMIGDTPSTNVDRISQMANQAHTFLRGAADSREGFAELLIRQAEGGPGKSGVSRGGFKAITYRTPWDYQRARRRR